MIAISVLIGAFVLIWIVMPILVAWAYPDLPLFHVTVTHADDGLDTLDPDHKVKYGDFDWMTVKELREKIAKVKGEGNGTTDTPKPTEGA